MISATQLVHPHSSCGSRLVSPVMPKHKIQHKEMELEPRSVCDTSGRIFYWQGRAFREVQSVEAWAIYRSLLASPAAARLFAEGLVETWIPDDVYLEGSIGLLEHRRIGFVSCRAEWTQRMIWDAANRYVDCAEILSREGLAFKDCHPWNVLFDFCRPTIIDFGSITPLSQGTNWLNELRQFFVLPLWLRKAGGSIGATIAGEMRYEHHHGIGVALSRSRYGSLLPLRLAWLVRKYRRAIATNDTARLASFFGELQGCIQSLEPKPPKEYWASYQQGQDNPTPGQARKQQCVMDVLKRIRPSTVLDMGANKGWYAFAAESLGCQVVAFDREEHCVDLIYQRGQAENRRVLPLHMDFLLPTPPSGVALVGANAFERLKCDVSLVLGLVHHLAITQRFNFDTIASIVGRYTEKAAIIEFVPREDPHIARWSIPLDYTKENFIKAMARRGLSLVNDQPLLTGRSLLVFERNWRVNG